MDVKLKLILMIIVFEYFVIYVRFLKFFLCIFFVLIGCLMFLFMNVKKEFCKINKNRKNNFLDNLIKLGLGWNLILCDMCIVRIWNVLVWKFILEVYLCGILIL